jgi:prepilin-type N-terminal cleavage/methylation domain-containing protein
VPPRRTEVKKGLFSRISALSGFRRFSDSSGVTVIELLVAVSIVGIMSVMAVAGVGFIQAQRLNDASRQLLGDFQRIRQKAMTQSNPSVAGGTTKLNRGFGIRFVSNTSYVTFEFIDSGATPFTYEVAEEYEETGKFVAGARIAPTPNAAFPASITVTNGAAGNPTGNVVLYDKRGMIRSSDWTIPAQSLTYVLRLPSGSTAPKCILVDPIRIREGTWNGATCAVS